MNCEEYMSTKAQRPREQTQEAFMRSSHRKLFTRAYVNYIRLIYHYSVMISG